MIDSFGRSDIGLVRQRNEDAWDQVRAKRFYALADGMGGHLGGDVAAQESVSSVCHFVEESFPEESCSIERAMGLLRSGIELANEAVYALSRSDRSLRGMGSTLCCLYVCGKEIVRAHVGDSRIYRLRDGRLKRLTRDHSLLTELLESGRVSEEEAERFIYKHVITRAIGTRPYVTPEIQHEAIHDQDVYMMCSDGLTDVLRDPEIEEILVANPEIERAAEKLGDSAYERGAPDNITTLFVRIHEEDLPG